MTEKHMETINFRFYECVLEISNEKSTLCLLCFLFKPKFKSRLANTLTIMFTVHIRSVGEE